MADSSGTNGTPDTIATAQAQKEVTANAYFDAASPAILFGRRASASSGLTWGFYGGEMMVDGVLTPINNGSVILTASATNFVEATRAGVVSSNTVGFSAGQIPLYEVVCGTSAVTSWTDRRAWVEPRHLTANVSLAITTADVTLTAAQARAGRVVLTGTLTGNRALIVPNDGRWIVQNDTTGAFAVTVRTAAGTGPQVPRGRLVELYADGTNVRPVDAGAFSQALAYAASIAVNAALGERVIVGALTGALTLSAPTNAQPGAVLEFAFLQDATGGRVITWDAAFAKAADGAGTANQRASARYLFDGTRWVQQGGALAWFA